MNKRTLLKSLVAAGCVAALSLGSFSSACAEEFREVPVGVVGDYDAQWDTVNGLLAQEKISVKLIKYSDYATPNRALDDGEIDLNAFQHKAYLANDIERNGYKIVSIGDTLLTPLRIYNNKEKIKSLSDF